MRFRLCTFITFIFIACLLWIGAGAQERRGTIVGHVADASHGILQGARVQVQPTGQTTATDGQGQFTISGLPPGKYTVNVSYVGFAPYSTEVTVNAGEVAKLDAVMAIGKVSEEVIVRADRQRGEEEALNRERTADNILQVPSLRRNH